MGQIATHSFKDTEGNRLGIMEDDEDAN